METNGLSERGALNHAHRDIWGPRIKLMANQWSFANDGGLVNLRLAENSLMHREMSNLITSQVAVEATKHLTYSTGPRGSIRLRCAAANFLNESFHSNTKITLDDIFITSGAAGAIDALAWSICDSGDGILIPQPYYNGFDFDLLNRSNVIVVGVSYHDVPGYGGLEDNFDASINRQALDSALQKARSERIRIRALMISNPHNPLGRCYPSDTLAEFMSFCHSNNLHLISDEIYAFSVFPNPNLENSNSFTSVLSLTALHMIDPRFLHVIYGASKDFCANGLRLGLVCTKNEGVIGAMSSISMFSWPSHIIQDIWAYMLEDTKWRNNFIGRKLELMEANYRLVTGFLSEIGVDWFQANAGLFVWTDLRSALKSTTDSVLVNYTGQAASPAAEAAFIEVCSKAGVMIAPGHIYHSEDNGWFRITFTLEPEALQKGLERLKISLGI
ncbi:PLP-dependent transferase [Aaosphaeria arxii CBS 175.79]|uniref:PLP-dependent transferase n=1 Tax=Aaosphaeria arxii CBS 175.79 TaxID=1450172 RepID=A0A6A5Y0N3_9PLEO|nr:PLP-dependent transferase [Aaosphaeria arxii CBS 175.79]KAF2018114.1 PLP-dependent transferase [Aaosphaeria arxii CBS 175.79]